MELSFWRLFCRTSWTSLLFSGTPFFLWFSGIWSFEVNISFTVLIPIFQIKTFFALPNDQSFLPFIESDDMNCILIDWLIFEYEQLVNSLQYVQYVYITKCSRYIQKCLAFIKLNVVIWIASGAKHFLNVISLYIFCSRLEPPKKFYYFLFYHTTFFESSYF